MNKLELYQLRYVIEVAKYQNFSLAANEVCVTPSSLSQQIKKLEDEIGTCLFERTTRSVHLTSAGKEFVEKAETIMNEISSIDKAMRKYVIGESGHLSIGGTPALKVNGITHSIAQFQKQYPNITLSILEAECFDLYPLLESKKIDVAFLTAFDNHQKGKMTLEGIPLVHDELVLVTNKNHRFASRDVVDLKEAEQEKFIFFCKSSGLYVQTMNACYEAGFEPKGAFETQYVDTCLGLVAEGIGIALVSSNSVENTLWKNIAIIPLKKKVPRIMSLVYPKRKNLSPVLKNFINFFNQHALQHSPSLYSVDKKSQEFVTLQ